MVKEFDDDGSGLIEFEEFLVLMAKKVDSSATLLFAHSIAENKNLKILKS